MLYYTILCNTILYYTQGHSCQNYNIHMCALSRLYLSERLHDSIYNNDIDSNTAHTNTNHNSINDNTTYASCTRISQHLYEPCVGLASLKHKRICIC